jgi:hypothetical protein
MEKKFKEYVLKVVRYNISDEDKVELLYSRMLGKLLSSSKKVDGRSKWSVERRKKASIKAKKRWASKRVKK